MSVSHNPVRATGGPTSEPRSFLDALDEVSEAVEAGAGLPSVARAAGNALGASVIVLDSSSSVLAVACASPEDERAVMAGEGDTQRLELTVAESVVGQRALPIPRDRAAPGRAADRGQPAGARAGPGEGPRSARARRRWPTS